MRKKALATLVCWCCLVQVAYAADAAPNDAAVRLQRAARLENFS
jgi:hypothetical protein